MVVDDPKSENGRFFFQRRIQFPAGEGLSGLLVGGFQQLTVTESRVSPEFFDLVVVNAQQSIQGKILQLFGQSSEGVGETLHDLFVVSLDVRKRNRFLLRRR